MKTFQVSIALSAAALVLALFSVAMQIDWGSKEPDAGANGPIGEEQSVASDPDGSTRTTSSANAATADGGTSGMDSSGASAQLEEKVARLERQLEGLNRLVRASGLDVAVPMWDAGSGAPGPLFEQLGQEAASRTRFETRREELSRQASDSKDNDYARYGPERYSELEELYRAARPSRGSDTQEDQARRTEALDRMVDEFPDAYSTGVAVAEQALSEALSGNTEQVEARLQTLAETVQRTNIVTDQGMEAVPTIKTFLARQYIDEKRVEEAASLLQELDESYPDSLIVEPPSAGNTPTPPRTASEIAAELRQQIGIDPNVSAQ